jgi:hypothetical protein
MHAALGDQPLRFADIPLRPRAPLAPLREALPVRRLVALFDLTVDPPMAERLLECFVVGQARRLDYSLFGKHEPHAERVVVMLAQPRSPGVGVLDDQLRLLARHVLSLTRPRRGGSYEARS